MRKPEIYECVLCGEEFDDWGNNPYPLKDEGKCCTQCNWQKVIPARLKRHFSKKEV